MWSEGEAILMRHVRFGRVVQALPVRVVEDDGRRLVTWIAPGTECMYPYGLDDCGNLLPLHEWRIAPRRWTGSGNVDVLRDGESFAVRHVWAGGDFDHWYVNLQEPYRRNEHGYDTMDHQVDVLLRPGGKAELKDKQHLSQAVALGLFEATETERFAEEARRILRGAGAIVPTGFESFVPPASWSAPPLPEDWHVV